MSRQPSSVIRGLIAATGAAVLLAACSSHDGRLQEVRPEAMPQASTQSAGARAAVIAVRQVGAPYRYGGNGSDGFDCSGLVHFAYAGAGKTVPRTTLDLWRQTEPIRGRDLAVGDILFFDIEGKVAHVGLYLGSGRFVHAPATGREVTVADLGSDFYRKAFVRGGRPR